MVKWQYRSVLFLLLFSFASGEILQNKVLRDFIFETQVSCSEFVSNPIVSFRDSDAPHKKYEIFVNSKGIVFSGSLFYRDRNYKFDLGEYFSLKVIADGVELKVFVNGEQIFYVQDGVSRQGKIKLIKNDNVSYKLSKIKLINNGMDTVSLSPKQSMQSFILQNNLKIKLLADDRLIHNPVGVKFDAQGRLWVIEMSGYMRKNEKGVFDIPGGNIVLLTDEDKDGVYDKRTVFIENSPMPRAVEYMDNGILYADEQRLYFVEEKNGKKGKVEVVDEKYTGTRNPEKDSNGLLRAIDNWIYSANSSIRYKRKNGKWLKERSLKRGQWGIDQDNYGRLFYTSNSKIFIGDILLPGIAVSNKNDFSQLLGKKYYSKISRESRVYPVVNNYVNRGYLKGTLDSKGRLVKATSVSAGTVYGGKNLPDFLYNSFIVTEPAGNLIKALRVNDTSKGFKVTNLYEKTELLQSYDRVFRPVDIRTAPNGSLVIVDFHRGLIQHNIYLTDYLKNLTFQDSLEEIMDLGRIYQVYDESRPLDKVEDLTKKTTSELVELLKHHNKWWRQTAQNLIVDRQEKSDEVKRQLFDQLLNKNNDEVSRIHTLWTIEGLDWLREELVLELLERTTGDNWLRKHLFHSLRSRNQLVSEKLFEKVKDDLINNSNSRVYSLQLLSKFSSSLAKKFFTKMAEKFKKRKDLLAIQFLHLDRKELKDKYNLNWNDYFPKPKVEKVSFSEKKKLILKEGRQLFLSQCNFCHGSYGQGIVGVAPPLEKSEWVVGSKSKLIAVTLKGLVGPITVNGKKYSGGVMPNFEKVYNDNQIAALLSFIRNSMGNRASFISTEDVSKVRADLRDVKESFTEQSLIKKYR